MTDATTQFFERLGSEEQPMLSQVSGTIRFDLDDRGTTKHWYLDIDKGKVEVSQKDAPADAVIQTHRPLFERAIHGEANAMAATLRGQFGVEGDPKLVVAFQRVLPGPSRVAASPSRKESAR
jgi:putative sterol carrier protein